MTWVGLLSDLAHRLRPPMCDLLVTMRVCRDADTPCVQRGSRWWRGPASNSGHDDLQPPMHARTHRSCHGRFEVATGTRHGGVHGPCRGSGLHSPIGSRSDPAEECRPARPVRSPLRVRQLDGRPEGGPPADPGGHPSGRGPGGGGGQEPGGPGPGGGPGGPGHAGASPSVVGPCVGAPPLGEVVMPIGAGIAK